MSNSRKCFICGRQGRHNKSEFLCEKCLILALKRPLFRCSNCNSTGVVIEEVENILRNRIGEDMTHPCVILTNYCSNCVSGLNKIELSVKIYGLNKNSYS
ncbi:MAG: hypothetical protein N2746_02530 [Deltaproteobacteria bacterium]|nr:hypothetical protein [Deltaproteobacteria bacterium]